MKKALMLVFLMVIVIGIAGCDFFADSNVETIEGNWEMIELNKTSSSVQALNDDENDNFFDFYVFNLEHSSGDITVSTWDDPDENRIGIRITKTAYGKDPEILLEQSGFAYNWGANDNDLEVETLIPYDLDNDEDVVIEFEIMFPQGIQIDLHSESSEGDIDISKIIGNVEAHTSNGNIKIVDIETESILYVETSNGNIYVEDVSAEKVEVHTSNGNIEALDIRTELITETSNGSISVNGAEGRLEVQNSDGAITLENIKLNDYANIQGSEGNIYLELLEVTEGDYEVESSDGDIDILFPEDIQLEIEVTGNVGKFNSNFLEFPADEDNFILTYPEEAEDGLAIFKVETDGIITLNK